MRFKIRFEKDTCEYFPKFNDQIESKTTQKSAPKTKIFYYHTKQPKDYSWHFPLQICSNILQPTSTALCALRWTGTEAIYNSERCHQASMEDHTVLHQNIRRPENTGERQTNPTLGISNQIQIQSKPT